ncbi:GNAT family N-acetyltransferase [Thalassomonas haliotis]|uniref:GNAT family N-acetyltransferase n=1 Tax=Thalassomonas haliotis TaxID=485448 RepID=A0ABY7VGB5_9GAMM|nr:GNAT family N-acetyltransferase [Thalassomonas haliotis]WDE11712.1 GNAT family N-acetyltransferase [Thalassomonas haliotis]
MIQVLPRLTTENLQITVLQPGDYALLQDYYRENEQHLAPWEPLRETDYHQGPEVQKRLTRALTGFNQGRELHFAACWPGENEIVALATYSHLIHGPFQACYLGYSVAKKYQGRGLMAEMLIATNAFVFEQLGMHRIMANYMPENIRSERLLQRLGFEKEGLAKSYLKIAGQWRDHILTAKINPAEMD